MTRFLIIIKNEYYNRDEVISLYTNGKIPLNINSENTICIAINMFDLKSKENTVNEAKNKGWEVAVNEYDYKNIRISHILELTYDGDMLFNVEIII